MPTKLTDHIAIVTGSARGIGASIARTLAESGARVAIVDLDASGAAEQASQLTSEGQVALSAGVDVTDEGDVAGLVARIEQEWGKPDILVNNAGISQPAPTLEMTTASWRRVIEVNLTAAFICSRAVLAGMRENGWGRVVNVVSFAAKSSPIYADNASYAASKAGLVGLIHNLAVEFAPHGITVNGVAPGIVDTELLRGAHTPERRAELLRRLPVGRFTRPDEVASLVAFLASESAGSITGEIVNINGGLYLD